LKAAAGKPATEPVATPVTKKKMPRRPAGGDSVDKFYDDW